MRMSLIIPFGFAFTTLLLFLFAFVHSYVKLFLTELQLPLDGSQIFLVQIRQYLANLLFGRGIIRA